MALSLLLFVLAAGAIYVACELFINGIEWLGHRLQLGATAVGTVLAAMGTALPESAVTFSGVVLGDSGIEREIGVGAAMGGPLVLSTLAYAVVGLVMLLRGYRRVGEGGTLPLAHDRLARDQAWFLVAFVCKVLLGLISFEGKRYTAAAFVALYLFYLWGELSRREPGLDAAELPRLRIRPQAARPALGWAALQVALTLGAMAYASHIFVEQLVALGRIAHLPPHVVALVFSPVATELPEIMNAVIWARAGRQQLALANISGAMMIQATIPSALGIGFTAWRFDGPLIEAGAITTAAVLAMYLMFRRGPPRSALLLGGFALYGIFLAVLLT